MSSSIQVEWRMASKAEAPIMIGSKHQPQLLCERPICPDLIVIIPVVWMLAKSPAATGVLHSTASCALQHLVCAHDGMADIDNIAIGLLC